MGLYEEMAEESLAYDYINEMARSKMEPSTFGIPSQKKYPMQDAKHVKLAIKFFNHCDKEHEEELARNIKKKIKEYGVGNIKYSEKNRFFNYYKAVKEDASSMFCFDEQVITEANIFQTIKEKIKKAIVSFIEMLERLLKKGKESKFKTKLLDILDRAKKNLTKCNNMSTPKEAKECEEELKKEQKEFEDAVQTGKDKFEQSVEDAKKAGVPEDEILKSRKDVDDYFMGSMDDLDQTKEETLSRMAERHKAAAEIMKDAMESIKKNGEEMDKTHSKIDDLLKQLNSDLDEKFDNIDDAINGPDSEFDKKNPGLREELLKHLR